MVLKLVELLEVDGFTRIRLDHAHPADVLRQCRCDLTLNLTNAPPRFADTPAHVSFGNRIACGILRMLTGRRFHDLGPFRAVRFDVLGRLALRDPDYGWNVEMQARAVGEGLRIAEVPVSHHPRSAGRSKISGSIVGTVRAGSKIVIASLAEGWRARKLRKAHGE